MTDTTKTPYWLTEDEKPDELLYDDLRVGLRDLYDRVTVSVTGSSNAGYDGAWISMEGEFSVDPGSIRLHTAASPEYGIEANFICKGSISANMSKAELIRLRNAIDMKIATMEFKDD